MNRSRGWKGRKGGEDSWGGDNFRKCSHASRKDNNNFWSALDSIIYAGSAASAARPLQ